MTARRGGTGASRRAPLLALLVLLLLVAVGAASCGGSSSADAGPLLGVWQRVEAGTPNPDFTLTITARGDDVELTLANRVNGMSQAVTGKVKDGAAFCTLPNAEGDSLATPLPGVPTESDLKLTLDEGGLLVVDLVLPSGVLEPIWLYWHADGASSE